MENIVRIGLWFGMLRQPSHDSTGSVGEARHSEFRGRMVQCPFGWAEHNKFHTAAEANVCI